MRRLDFVLPDFFRCLWTSDHARRQWEPRIGAVAVAIAELQWLTVAKGVRVCGIARLSPEQLERKRPHFANRGVEAMTLRRESRVSVGYQSVALSYVPGKPFQYCIAFGKHGAARELVHAVTCDNHRAVGALLGYPDCCVGFFLENCKSNETSDTTWPMARASLTASEELENDGRTIRIKRPSLANILLRGVGVRAVFHLPCRFDCPGSIEFAEHLIAVGSEEGFALEMEWLSEILHWPMEWNSLHGIAEIKTPVLKCCTSSGATAVLHRVLVEGSEFPKEAAKGIGHAYQAPG